MMMMIPRHISDWVASSVHVFVSTVDLENHTFTFTVHIKIVSLVIFLLYFIPRRTYSLNISICQTVIHHVHLPLSRTFRLANRDPTMVHHSYPAYELGHSFDCLAGYSRIFAFVHGAREYAKLCRANRLRSPPRPSFFISGRGRCPEAMSGNY